MDMNLKAIQETYDPSPFAFCVIRVRADAQGDPSALELVYANAAVSALAGVPLRQLATEYGARYLSANTKWLEFYGRVAFEGKADAAIHRCPGNPKSVQVQCYQLSPGYCGCLFTDVTQQEALQSQTAQNLQTERTVVSCVQKLISSPDFRQSVSHVLNSILDYYRGSRVYIFSLDWETNTARNAYERCAPGALSRIQGFQQVPLSAMDVWIKGFQAGSPVCIPDITAIRHLPQRREEYEMLLSQGISRALAVPYYFEDTLQGFIGVDDPEVHENDIEFLKNLTYFISVEMQKHLLNQRLRTSEEKFRIATQNSNIAFWTYDHARRAILQTDASKSQHHSFEMIVEDVPESLIECGYIRKDSQQAFLEMYRLLKDGAKTAGGDFWTYNDKTGGWWCERIRYTNVFDQNGKPVLAYAVGIDVTKEIQQEMDRKKLDVTLANSHLYIWEYDLVGKRSVQQANGVADFGTPQILENFPQSMIEAGKIHADSIQDFRILHQQVEDGAPSAQQDIRLIQADGSFTWMRCTYTTIFTDGKPVSAIGCAVDINSVKQMERQLQEETTFLESLQSESLLAKARTNVTQGIVELYTAKNLVDLSPENTDYDVTLAQLTAAGLTQQDRDTIQNALSRDRILGAFAKGETACSIHYQVKTQDGGVMWVNTTAKIYQNPETGDVMSFLYTYNISDQKIKDSIIDAVTVLEYDYIAYIDLKREQFRLYTGEEHAQQLLPTQAVNYTQSVYEVNRAVVVPEDVDRAISDMLPDGIRKNLAAQTVFSTVYSVYDEHKNIRHKRLQYAYLDAGKEQVVCTRTDVTNLLQRQKQQQDTLEAALLAAEQANSAKSDFLSRMSHEIRTPMNAIIGMATIAAQSLGDDAQVADCIGKIGISSRFLLSLINDILDMSRIESGKMLLKNEKIPFAEFLSGINSICYTQAKAKDLDYENVVDPNVEDYYVGDAMKLQQVAVNILSNAIKFTPRGGKVTFGVRQIKKDQNSATVRFVINDTGCGISEAFIPMAAGYHS